MADQNQGEEEAAVEVDQSPLAVQILPVEEAAVQILPVEEAAAQILPVEEAADQSRPREGEEEDQSRPQEGEEEGQSRQAAVEAAVEVDQIPLELGQTPDCFQAVAQSLEAWGEEAAAQNRHQGDTQEVLEVVGKEEEVPRTVPVLVGQ